MDLEANINITEGDGSWVLACLKVKYVSFLAIAALAEELTHISHRAGLNACSQKGVPFHVPDLVEYIGANNVNDDNNVDNTQIKTCMRTAAATAATPTPTSTSVGHTCR